MILKQTPPAVHTAFNPLTLYLTGTAGGLEILTIKAGDKQFDIDVNFDQQGNGEVEISGLLKSFFGKISDGTPLIADDYSSFRYELLSGDTSLGTFTAVNAVAQIRESHNLQNQYGRLLTGFNKLIAIDSPLYPRDVSALTLAPQWERKYLDDDNIVQTETFDTTPGKVNRLPFTCKQWEITAPPSLTTGTLQWSDHVCQQKGLIINQPQIFNDIKVDEMDPRRIIFLFGTWFVYPVTSQVTVNLLVRFEFDTIEGHKSPEINISIVTPLGEIRGEAENEYIEIIEVIEGSVVITDIIIENIEPRYDDTCNYSDIYIPPENTGYKLYKTLTYKKYENGSEVETVTKNILTDVTPVLNENQYKLLSIAEVDTRAQNLIQSLNPCDGVEHLNSVSEENHEECPIPFIDIDGVSDKTLSFNGCQTSTQQITINSSNTWNMGSLVPSWLNISPQSGTSGSTTLTVTTQSTAQTDRAATFSFSTLNRSANLTINQSKCQTRNIMLNIWPIFAVEQMQSAKIEINGITYTFNNNGIPIDVPVEITGYPHQVEIKGLTWNNGDYDQAVYLSVEDSMTSDNISIINSTGVSIKISVNHDISPDTTSMQLRLIPMG